MLFLSGQKVQTPVLGIKVLCYYTCPAAQDHSRNKKSAGTARGPSLPFHRAPSGKGTPDDVVEGVHGPPVHMDLVVEMG